MCECVCIEENFFLLQKPFCNNVLWLTDEERGELLSAINKIMSLSQEAVTRSFRTFGAPTQLALEMHMVLGY